MKLSLFSLRALAAVAGVAALAACESASNTTGLSSAGGTGANLNGYPAPAQGEFSVCKDGTDATFGWTLNGNAQQGFSLAAGNCTLLYTNTAGANTVQVTETVPTDAVLDSIVAYNLTCDTQTTCGAVVKTVITGTNSAGSTYYPEGGRVLIFYNRELPPPPGGEGCTPGYWKQEQHFDSWTSPYTPSTLFSAVFEDAFPGMTLLQVLSQGGGGLKALGRHTVAALLNTASADVDYDMTTQGVIDAFNAVYPGGDYEGQKNIFAGYNELGCPLN